MLLSQMFLLNLLKVLIDPFVTEHLEIPTPSPEHSEEQQTASGEIEPIPQDLTQPSEEKLKNEAMEQISNRKSYQNTFSVRLIIYIILIAGFLLFLGLMCHYRIQVSPYEKIAY